MENDSQQWRGYTLDELRVRRLVNLTRIELEQTRLSHMTERFSSKATLKSQLPVVSKMFHALDYVDYAVLAFKLGRKVLNIFRRRKR